MKQVNKLYAEFLKTQMNNKKNQRDYKMSEEEFRINRELIDDIAYRTPGPSKKGFLI